MAKASAARAAQVKARTKEMNDWLMIVAQSKQATQPASAPPPATPLPAAQEEGSSGDQLAERLKKLEALFKAGLITKEDYDTKKAEILSALLSLAYGGCSPARSPWRARSRVGERVNRERC